MNAPTGGQVTEPRPVSFDIPTYVGLPEERRRLALVVAEFIFPEEWEGLVNSIRDAEVEHYMNENPLTPADKAAAQQRAAERERERAEAML